MPVMQNPPPPNFAPNDWIVARLPNSADLSQKDSQPCKTKRHGSPINLFISPWQNRTDLFVAGNLFIFTNGLNLPKQK